MEDLHCFFKGCRREPSSFCKCITPPSIFCKPHTYEHVKTISAKQHRISELFSAPNGQTRRIAIERLHLIKNDIKICKKNLITELGKAIDCLKIWRDSAEKVSNLPKVDEISLALRLPPLEAQERVKSWELKTPWLNLDEPIEFINNAFEKVQPDPFKAIYGQKFVSRKLPYWNNQTKKIVSVDLCSKNSKSTAISALPQLMNYGVGMCPIPGENIFCYGNYYWCCKGLTFIIDKSNYCQILPCGKPNNNLSIVCFNNTIYAIGGIKNLSEKFSLKKSKWKSLNSLLPGNYKHSSSLIYADTLLIVAKYRAKITNYDIKNKYFDELPIPVANDKICKKLFSAEGRAFLVEASGRLYDSSIGDISYWNYVNKNSLRNTYFVSFEVFFDDDVYFMNRWWGLIKFDVKLREFSKCDYT